MILYCAADLIWATRIKRTGEAIGIECRPVKTPEKLGARLSEVRALGSWPEALIVDLESDEALDLIGALRAAEASEEGSGARARVLAFGPHVKKDLMQAARDRGADDVLPRGAFDRELPDLLVALAGR